MQGFGNAAGTDTVTFKLSLYIQDIEGINDQVSIHTLIKNLPANDFNFIRDLVFTPPFGVNTKVKVQCPLCTSDFESDLPLDLSFFFPKGKKMTPLA
jgi:hypothetical protein